MHDTDRADPHNNQRRGICCDRHPVYQEEYPKRQFNKPKDAVYVSIRGREEAFKPGTEPQITYTPVEDGPTPYLDAWEDTGGTPPVVDETPLVTPED